MFDFEKAPNISCLGIFLGALASHFIGALWFGPLFGKLWLKYSNWDPEQIKKTAKQTMMRSMLISFIAQIVMAVILAYVLGYMKVQTVVEAVKIAFLLGVGFIATTTINGHLWHTDKLEFFLINLASNITRLVAMTAVYASIAL